MVHWLDQKAGKPHELKYLLRTSERRKTPPSAFMNALLTSIQALAVAFLLEMYRGKGFQFALNIAESLRSQCTGAPGIDDRPDFRLNPESESVIRMC
jgi:hypothetical protein